jgi:O-antigen/teichoic acid export membrane protein
MRHALITRRWSLLLNRETLWSAATQAFSSGVSLLVSVVAARLLGVDQFGQYVLVLAGVFLLGSLQHHLVTGPMMILSGLRRRSEAYYDTLARWIVLAGVGCGAILAIYALAVFALQSRVFRLDMALVGFTASFGTVIHDDIKRLLFVQGRPRTAFLIEVARHAIFGAAVCLAVIFFGIGPAGLLICLGGSAGLVAAFFLLPMLRGSPPRRLHVAVRGRHWQLGRWMALMVAVSSVHENGVTVVSGVVLGDWAAGGLRSAQIMFGPIQVLMTSFDYFIPRTAAEQFSAAGRERLLRYLQHVFLIGSIPIVGYCTLMAAFKDPVLLLLGPEYRAFGTIVSLMAVAPPIIFLRELGMVYLRVTGQTRGVFLSFVGSAITVAMAMMPLIWACSVIGAAIAVVLGHAVSMALVLACCAIDYRHGATSRLLFSEDTTASTRSSAIA